MKTIKFSKDYPKLNDILFSTIRAKPKKLRTGQVCRIESPTMEFNAILARKHTTTLREMDTEDLLNDTNTNSRENDTVRVLWFVKDRRP